MVGGVLRGGQGDGDGGHCGRDIVMMQYGNRSSMGRCSYGASADAMVGAILLVFVC